MVGIFGIAPAIGSTAEEEHLLIRKAVAGKPPAVRLLVRRLMPVVRSRVRAMIAGRAKGRLSPHEEDDVTQEVWLALFKDQARQLLAYDSARGLSLEAYAGMIAEREVSNALQRVRALKRGGGQTAVDEEEAAEVPGSSGPEEEVVAQNLAAALGDVIARELPMRGQLVFRYLYTDGNAPDEVAAILGVKIQVVYNWQHKIRQLATAFLGAAAADQK